MWTKIISGYQKIRMLEECAWKILRTASVTCFAFSFFCVTFQVFHRYVLAKLIPFTFPYTDELSRLAVIIGIYLMLPVVFEEKGHPSLDLLFRKMPHRIKLFFYYFIKAVMLLTCITVMVYGIRFIELNRLFRSAVCRIPAIFLYSWPVIGFVLLSVQIVMEMLGVALGMERPEITRMEEEDGR